jgi:anaerobic dimethyl sulfoxide reductase subunit B (iron-sulfur subunit)
MTQRAFFFDASACSGCKACQAACKDKNNLPVGRLWRRVYEVTGGGWTHSGAAWVNDVFAYNLSLSCQHCQRPICVEVCPTQAMHRRADGIVLVDETRCMGCRYCSWACPYDALQYDAAKRRMTKCNFCLDDLETGRPPACVAACPLRALDCGELNELEAKQGRTVSLPPLPADSITQPALIVKPHRAAGRAAHLGNGEEIGAAGRQQEQSLVAFTLLSQLAVGAFWMLSLLNGLTAVVLAVLALIMLAALTASFFHLGAPHRAWRAVNGWRTSWLSREIACAALFEVLLIGSTIAAAWHSLAEAGVWMAGAIGLALLICMGQTYRLRTIPRWRSWLTPVSFFLTALILGSFFAGARLSDSIRPEWAAVPIGLLIAQNGTALRMQRSVSCQAYFKAQLGLAAMAVLALVGMPGPIGWWTAFALAFGSEAAGRILFYKARARRGMWRWQGDEKPVFCGPAGIE